MAWLGVAKGYREGGGGSEAGYYTDGKEEEGCIHVVAATSYYYQPTHLGITTRELRGKRGKYNNTIQPEPGTRRDETRRSDRVTHDARYILYMCNTCFSPSFSFAKPRRRRIKIVSLIKQAGRIEKAEQKGDHHTTATGILGEGSK